MWRNIAIEFIVEDMPSNLNDHSVLIKSILYILFLGGCGEDYYNLLLKFTKNSIGNIGSFDVYLNSRICYMFCILLDMYNTNLFVNILNL